MKKVLIINDSRLESLVLKDMINKINLIPIVSNEYDALKNVVNESPAIVIVNYIMEDINGDELAEKIKIVLPEVKCILSSCDNLNKNEYKDKYIDRVIKTPIEFNTLIEIILDFIS